MWNYLGWDSISTASGEIADPRRSLPRALMLGIGLVTVSYALPAWIGIAAVPDLEQWVDGGWVPIAAAIGGPALGGAILVSGLVSAAGLFMGTLFASSRIPFVLADEGYLPKRLTQVHPKYQTPWIAILVSAAFYSVFSFASFEKLAVVDVTLYSGALLLEFVALVVLRKTQPDMRRPFRIPGGWFGVILCALLPTGVVAFAVTNHFLEEGAQALQWSAIALAFPPVLYGIQKVLRKAP